ncbi:hypothetical protein [Allocoleopsis franciscana]|nr:hypothetical protein [Allocoleopsis franciscana]
MSENAKNASTQSSLKVSVLAPLGAIAQSFLDSHQPLDTFVVFM